MTSVTGDKQWPAYEPDDESPWGREPTVLPQSGQTPTPEPPPTPYVPYGGSTPYDTPAPLQARRRRRSGLFVAIPVLAMIAGVAVAVQDLTSDDSASTRTDGAGPFVPDIDLPDFDPNVSGPPPDGADPGTPDVHSPEGYAELLDALRERTGSTKVFEAVLYPEYASLDVPVDGSSQREESLFYDGELEDQNLKGTASERRIDLADIDPALLVRLLARARKLVDDPTSNYLIIRGRSTVFSDDGARIFAYASNEFSESAYIATRLDGTLVRRITP